MLHTLLRSVLVAGVAVATLTTAAAQSPELTIAEYVDRFELFNECRSMDLLVEELDGVEGLDSDAAAIGLTEDRIRTLTESRLRAARLYGGDSLLPLDYVLYVRIGVLVSENRRGGAYSIDVNFRKLLHDPVADDIGMATTWRADSYGTHGGDSGFILQSLSEHLDRFILEYLRVNEPAC